MSKSKTDAALRANAEANMPRTSARPEPFSRVVHAYRREPMMVGDKEVPVPVEVDGEKALFRSNEEGHVVATVTSEAMYNRLVKGIPEAYVVYQDGKNIPERVKPGAAEPEVGKFVLLNGDNKMVLDDLNDEQLREFAKANDVQVHESIEGDDLRQAIFNRFQTS